MSKNIKLLIIFVVLILVYFLTNRSESTVRFNRNLTEIDSAAINKIEISKSGKSIELKKVAEAWLVDNYQVDLNALSRFISEIRNIKISRKVSDQASRYEDYQITDELATKLSIYHNDQISIIFIGKEGSSYSNLIVRKEDDVMIYESSNNFRNYLDNSEKDWKDKTILKTAKENIASIKYRIKNNQYVIVNNDSVQFIENLTNKNEVKAEMSYLGTSMLNSFSNLLSSDFPIVENPDFANVQFQIELMYRNGMSSKLLMIPKANDDTKYLVKLDENPTIFEINKTQLSNFEKPYSELIKK